MLDRIIKFGMLGLIMMMGTYSHLDRVNFIEELTSSRVAWTKTLDSFNRELIDIKGNIVTIDGKLDNMIINNGSIK